jgi:starvation-inducible DNA-binding protein
MPLSVRWDLGKDAAREVATALNALLADAFALLVKTKGIRWHVSGPSVPGLRQLLSEMEAQAETTIEGIAERVRRIGEPTLRSIGEICHLQRLTDNRAACLSTPNMLDELLRANLQFAAFLRETHGLCEGYGDVATASHLEKWIDEAEGRIRYLFAIRHPD